MSNLPNCPKCDSNYAYYDNVNFICPDCNHEWNENTKTENNDELVVKDSNGNILQDGDTVVLIKNLKVKGSSITLKAGTKIKNIRLVDSDHNIDCKVDGISYGLKSEFMKKS